MTVTARQLLNMCSNHTTATWREAIGLVSMNWSILELQTDICIVSCLKTDGDFVECLTQQMQMMSKLDALASLLDRGWPDFTAQFSLVVNYIRNVLTPERNIVIHGIWMPEGDIALVGKKTAKGKLRFKDGLFFPERINKLAQDIADTSIWMEGLYHALPPSRKKPFGKFGRSPRQESGPQKALALLPLPSQT